MERIAPGANGIRFRIFGYGEAVAAFNVSPPAPAPSPAPSPSTSPLPTLVPNVPAVLIGVPNGRTYIGTAVDDAIIDVSDAASTVGFQFSIVLANTGNNTVTIVQATGEEQTFVIPAYATHCLLEFIVLSTDIVALKNLQHFPAN